MPLRVSQLGRQKAQLGNLATLASGQPEMARVPSRAELETSSMIHEASAAAGFSSIPQYLAAIQHDPDLKDRVEWTALFEAELMRRLKQVGWDPSNVTAESTAKALRLIGISAPATVQLSPMSGGAPPWRFDDPLPHYPMNPPRAPVPKYWDHAGRWHKGSDHDIPFYDERLRLERGDGGNPALENLGSGGGVTMPVTPNACADKARSRTGGMFGICGVIGGIDPVNPAAFNLDDLGGLGDDLPFWLDPSNPCYGLDPYLLLNVGDDPPADDAVPRPMEPEVLPSSMREYMEESEKDLFEKYVEEWEAYRYLQEQLAKSSAKLAVEEQDLATEILQAADTYGQTDPAEFDKLVAAANAKHGPLITAAKAEIAEFINLIEISFTALISMWGVLGRIAFPLPEGADFSLFETCRTWLAQAVPQCMFNVDGGGGRMDCGRPLVQCGPDALDCPSMCSCVREGGQRCTTLVSKGGGPGAKVCGNGLSWSYPTGPKGPIGGKGGTCDVACCAFAAGGWQEKCEGVSCLDCKR